MKICSLCKKEKCETEFYKRSDSRGVQYACKICSKARRQKYRADPENRKKEYTTRKKHRKNNPEMYRTYDTKANLSKFGLTINNFEELFSQQNGCCAICGKPEKAILNGKIKRLAVDHCHKTGKIRGLLCCGCNRGLGMFGENADLLKAAILYLTKVTVPS